MRDIHVLLISGSTREGSSNSHALEALHRLEQPGVTTEMYDGLRALPAFVPHVEPVPEPVDDLLRRLTRADAVVFSTPEYAGGLPGSLKNLLDWTVGGGELYGKPAAWLDVANQGRGRGARAQLATVLGYVGARVVEDACVRLTVDRTGGEARLAPGQHQDLSDAMAALRSAQEETT